MSEMTAASIVAGATLDNQIVAKRGGFWAGSVVLSEVADYRPSRCLSRAGDRWFRCSGVASVAGKRPLAVRALVLVCEDATHSPLPVWERV